MKNKQGVSAGVESGLSMTEKFKAKGVDVVNPQQRAKGESRSPDSAVRQKGCTI